MTNSAKRAELVKNTKPRTMKILVISAMHVIKSSSTRKTLNLTSKRYIAKKSYMNVTVVSSSPTAKIPFPYT